MPLSNKRNQFGVVTQELEEVFPELVIKGEQLILIISFEILK